MTTHRIRLDDLLGRVVRDESGQRIGRVYDMRAEERDGELVIVEYHVGAHAFLQRLGVSLVKLIGMRTPEPQKVPWDRLDISDPDHPKLISA
jgi:sporulation protein YlmC with PRC-barrel domain